MKEIISAEHDGSLLRNYILNKCGISHKLLTRLKAREDGMILNGQRVTVRSILKAGDVLELNFEDTENSDIEPIRLETMPEILYEDAELIILNKPPYMPTHPSHNHHSDTLANAVAYIFKERGEVFRFRAITRLDKNTSGTVLIAKNSKSASILSSMMEKGMIDKKYLAVCSGSLPDSFTVNKPIKREKESIITRIVCEDGDGQSAVTHFSKICEYNRNTLLSVTPITGRTHQIRVHLKHFGFPILGDELYGKASEEIGRQALHARELTLHFPDGRVISIRAPLFRDMKDLFPNQEF